MSSYPALPNLSDEELAQQFADDAEARRRYLLLHDVINRRAGQRDAAEQHGLSERTVRNILQSYRQGGLESLRTKRITPRRQVSRQSEDFAEALAEALVQEPSAGGDRLWHLAQAILGDQGALLTRRTAYRILGRLREQQPASEPEEERDLGDLRAALSLLLEDPPLSLGMSDLAVQHIPDEDDQLLRGTLIQQALRSTIDRLRPSGTVSAIDRSWWPYLICVGEYEAGQTRTELQSDLALSPSTYSRAKRQALVQIAAALPHVLAPLIAAPTTLSSKRLPRTPDFVGRHDEESYYAWRLQTEGSAIIWGLPGSGKTALAAELAAEGRRYGQTVLWHTCQSGRDATVAGIVQGLAQALASTSDDTLWRALRRMSADDRRPDRLIDMLAEHLSHRPSVVILDDAHRAAEYAPDVLVMLRELVRSRHIRLLLISRHRPPEGDWPMLRGLGEREAKRLWEGIGPLTNEQWAAIYRRSNGFPQPLRLAATAARRAGARFRLADALDDIDHWAHDTLWQRLSPGSQRLLASVPHLPEQAWNHPALLQTLSAEPADLVQIERLGLLERAPVPQLHPVVQEQAADFFRDDAALRTRVVGIRTLTAPVDKPAISRILVPSEQALPLPADPPIGMELLVRLRVALSKSAAYLQTQSDTDAATLVAELTSLQAALPELS